MLEVDYQQSLAEHLSSIHCEVQLPADWNEFFSRTGHLPSMEGDRRRFVRKHRPGLALLEVSTSLPAIPREGSLASVMTKNISRAGLSFLHTEELFPGEEITLWLPDGKSRCEVTRCQRLEDRCYEIAAVLLSGECN